MLDTYNIIKEPEKKTRQQLREAIIELNYYLLTAIDLEDKISILMIRREISEIMSYYLKNQNRQ